MTLEEDADRAQMLLQGKSVAAVWRHRATEVGIEFTDGTRLFVNWQADGTLDLSITGDFEDAP